MIGIDEVGRGCWAGPLLIVAARSKESLPVGMRDSKKLSANQRRKLYPLIKELCDIGEGWVTSGEIDKYGLTEAMRIGVSRALELIAARPEEEIIMDGLINYCPATYIRVTCAAKADDLYPIVSAASIFAKVKRDTYMSELKGRYKLYEFEKHVGYGTALHNSLIKLHGVSDIHRMSFAPIAKLANI